MLVLIALFVAYLAIIYARAIWAKTLFACGAQQASGLRQWAACFMVCQTIVEVNDLLVTVPALLGIYRGPDGDSWLARATMTLFVAARLAQCTTAVWLSVARIVAVTCPIWWRAADSWIAVALVADPWLWAMVFVIGLGSTALHAIAAIALAVTLKRQGRPSTRPLLGALLAMAPKLFETWILVASGLQELHPVHLFWGLCFANFAYGALQQAGVTLCYSEQSQRMRDRRNWLVWRAGVRGTRPPREPRRPPRDTATTSV